MSAASTPSRSLKRAALLRALRRTPGASRTTLAKELDFSLGTAQLLVDELIDEGILCAVGVNLSTGGRPSRRISRNRDGPLVLVMGVDLSQMEMRLGLFDLSGALVDGRRVPFERRGDQVQLRRIVAEIEHFAQAGHQRLAGVGLAVPGYLEAASGRVIYSANLGWRDRPGPGRRRGSTRLSVAKSRGDSAAGRLPWLVPGPVCCGSAG